MGLDMYMWKQKRINVYDFGQKGDCVAKKLTVKTIAEYEDGKKEEEEYVVNEPQEDGRVWLPVAYWRKANAIHKWFVDLSGEEDKCQKIYVNGSQIKSLVDTCKQILADHSKASELLPTQSGFFFGSTEYDEWYYEDLEKTVKMLADVDEDDEYIYQASW